jgi:predicted RNA binding protein YcfA (HicA-like mRNA interferase family)
MSVALREASSIQHHASIEHGCMKIRDVIKTVEQAGWQLKRTQGSHRQYQHPDKPEAGTLTIAGHPSKDVPKGLLNAMLKQAGLKHEQQIRRSNREG